MACFQPGQPSLARRNATISTFKSPSRYFFTPFNIYWVQLMESPDYNELACEIALLAAVYDGMSGLCNECCTQKREKKILHPFVFNILVSTLAIYFYKNIGLSSNSIHN
jgi:hypothetical protein